MHAGDSSTAVKAKFLPPGISGSALSRAISKPPNSWAVVAIDRVPAMWEIGHGVLPANSGSKPIRARQDHI